jgi:uncharacterized membrane protein
MKPSIAFSGLLLLVLLALLPFVFGEFVLASLSKLHLNPGTAGLIMVGMFAGGLINIPVKRYQRDADMVVHPLATYGLQRYWPHLEKPSRETVIAVNVGGCVIPLLLAIYELSYIAGSDSGLILATGVACAVNIAACYMVARPIEGIGIVLPGFVPPLIAVGCAMIVAPTIAAPVAFVAGVIGPLVGADLMHLREIRETTVGVASIGGAGTFDGIVLSGILAAYLA